MSAAAPRAGVPKSRPGAAADGRALESPRDILALPTPDAWLDAAASRVPELLLDHANCEKKAAATALSLLFRYPGYADLTWRMSRLAREELRHFEQVQALMRERHITFRRMPTTRYATGLREGARGDGCGRLVDILIGGAFIEARSWERFILLVPRLDPGLGRFYRGLAHAEARHFVHYLALARHYSPEPLEPRLQYFAELESDLATRPDPGFGFHSGPPAG